ncbi:MAG: lantibiotic dehydratase, partial [Terriglobales bacterium]
MLAETEAVQAEVQERPQAQRKYVLARNFVLRMTGFPTEVIQSAASQELAQASDDSFVLGARTVAAAQALLSSDAILSRSLRRRLKRGKAVAEGPQEGAEEEPLQGAARQQLEEYKKLYALEQEHYKKTAELYQLEYHRALKLLYQFVVSEPFQQILLLSSPELARFTPKDAEPPAVRNSHIRQREFTWISYLQRLTTKNETISFFGPSAWGEFDPEEPAAASIELSEQQVVEREVYVERWVCEALAELISADAEAQELLPVRLADDVIVKEDGAVFLATNQTVPLSAQEREILLACELAPRLGPREPAVAGLIERTVLAGNLQVPIAPYPFEALRRIVSAWPEHPARARWSARLADIENARAAVEQSRELADRQAALQAITQTVKDIGLDG